MRFVYFIILLITLFAGIGLVPANAALPGILAPTSLTIGVGDIKEFPVQLGTEAPPGGVYITMTSSDSTKLALSQSELYIPSGVTSMPRRITTLTGLKSGVVTVTVAAPGYASSTTQVQVGSGAPAPGTGTMTLTPATLAITGTETKILTLTLSNPTGVSGLSVNVTSSNGGIASVNPTITMTAGTTVATVSVQGVSPGTVTISASAANYGNATASVTVSAATPPPSTPPPTTQSSAIIVPETVSLAPGETKSYSVALAQPAPYGGALITLTSSDPSKATVWPSSFLILEGMMGPRRTSDTPLLVGVGAGSATITAAATGLGSRTTSVQIGSASSGGTLALSPSSQTAVAGNQMNLTLSVSGSIPVGGLIVYLNSSNTSAATVQSNIAIPVNGPTVTLPVAAVGAGASTITATAAGYTTATATVNVTATKQIVLPSSPSVTVGETVNLPVMIGATDSSDITISLNSSDATKLTVSPSSFKILSGTTSNAAVTTTIRGVGAGSAVITATSPGYTGANRSITVSSAPTTPPQTPALMMGLAPSNLSILGFVSQNLTLNLSGAAPGGGILITLKSANPAVATVPATITVGQGSISAAVPVTAVSAGSALITASAIGMLDATAMVTVTAATTGLPWITMPASLTLGPNQSGALSVSMSQPAPSEGLVLTLTSSDRTKVTVPATVTVSGRGSSVSVPVNSLAEGTATVYASAPGFTGASTSVQVTAGSKGFIIFQPGFIYDMNVGATQTVSVLFPSYSTAGMTVTFVSSDPNVATAPASLVVPASGTLTLPVTGVGAGSALITASAPGFSSSSLNVKIVSMAGVTLEFHGVCWHTVNFGGTDYKLHLADFILTTPTPVPIQATLWWQSADCSGGGQDNMNDFNDLYSSGHKILGFRNYPDTMPASVMYWIGPRTADGKCPAGAPCSGCRAFTPTTPWCSEMP